MVVDALASDKENAFPNFLYRITSGVIGFSIIGSDVDGTFLERQAGYHPSGTTKLYYMYFLLF